MLKYYRIAKSDQSRKTFGASSTSLFGQRNILTDLNQSAEEIVEAMSFPAKCKTGCHRWLCENKRSPGIEIFLYIFFFITLIFLSIDVKGSTVIFFLFQSS